MAFMDGQDNGGDRDGSKGRAMALEGIFRPRSVAFAGVSGDSFNSGSMLMGAVVDSGFKGEVYPVHPRGGDVMGYKCYTNIKEIPGPVDHVVVCIPARYTRQLVEDCVAKGVKSIAFFTAGFSETGAEDGKKLEAELVSIAREGGVRLIGPNCMGIYCPSSGLAIQMGMPKESGPVGYVCQSGGNTVHGVAEANSRGVCFSKAVSYGNACDVNETDLFEYFTHDPETEIIAAYVEGIRQGERFVKALREATQAKPVIILKGGRTDAGAATAASHTGSLACSSSVWKGLIEQTGAIQVESLEEMTDCILPFLYMKPPKGLNTAIIGIGGGASVIAADDCYSAGLKVPSLPAEMREELKELTTEAGNIFNNPIDTQSFMVGVEEFSKTVRIVADWDGIDLLIVHIAHESLMMEMGMTRTFVNVAIDTLKKIGKPTAVALYGASSPKGWATIFEEQQQCMDAGFPVFYSVKTAANAISKYLRYHQSRNNHHE